MFTIFAFLAICSADQAGAISSVMHAPVSLQVASHALLCMICLSNKKVQFPLKAQRTRQ
jgi:hypothetical protein